MRRHLFVWFGLLVAACSPPSASNKVPVPPTTTTAPGAEVAPEDSPLPLDARVKKGKLSNGLTYYVLQHKKPEKRAQIWLAVNAGSVLEDDDQRGLAHFVEHMGFNGTKRFPKQELVAFLEKSGVRFGADLNAYTSFDETVYKLQVPTDKPEIVSRAVSVLRDWADGVTFDPGEVEKERGVILEEWRLGRGASRRLFDKQAPTVFHGSKYAERLPIGLPEIIKGASRDKRVRFYQDWYRPDLMAVVAVGDFDPAKMEEQIRAEFDSLPAPTKPRPRPSVQLPPHSEPLVTIETDPEMPTTSGSLLSKLPHRPEASERDYRRSIGEQLYGSMLNARLDEMRRDPASPFLYASVGTSGFVRTADANRASAIVKEDGIERGFAALLEEVLRVERHGFTESELERAKRRLLKGFERAALERDKTDGAEFTAEIVRNFLEDEAMPGREAELELAKKLVPTFALSELNGLAKQLGAGSRVVTVAGPPTIARPTKEALLALEKDVAARTIAAYVDEQPSEPLLAQPPAPGKITSTKTIAEIGVTEWTLSNGVRVIAKPTEFSNDEVRMTAFSPGGTSLAKDADYVAAAEFADEVTNLGGLGPFDAVKLRKALSGKIASVQPRISELDEGLTGAASAGDMETLLQLTHLAFTAPRKDDKAFAAWRQRETEAVKNRRLSPDTLFRQELTVFANQGHLRRQPTTPETLAKVDLDKSIAFYRDRFADAGDFTFVFIGSFELDALRKLTETYLASLPTARRKEAWRDVKVAFPSGQKTVTVKKGTEPKSVVDLTLHGRETWSRDADNDMRMLVEVLRHELRQTLREDMGGVYGVQVGGGIVRRPRPEYRLTVRFGCAPENVEKLKQAVFDQIKAIQEKGVSAETLDKIKETRRRSHEVDLKSNTFWSRELERAYTYGDDPKLIPDIAPLIEKVTSARVQAAAKKYGKATDYVLGVLEPERK
mgnify:CR=1 FL=1